MILTFGFCQLAIQIFSMEEIIIIIYYNIPQYYNIKLKKLLHSKCLE